MIHNQDFRGRLVLEKLTCNKQISAAEYEGASNLWYEGARQMSHDFVVKRCPRFNVLNLSIENEHISKHGRVEILNMLDTAFDVENANEIPEAQRAWRVLAYGDHNPELSAIREECSGSKGQNRLPWLALGARLRFRASG
jgi:hypothetical protein